MNFSSECQNKDKIGETEFEVIMRQQLIQFTQVIFSLFHYHQTTLLLTMDTSSYRNGNTLKIEKRSDFFRPMEDVLLEICFSNLGIDVKQFVWNDTAYVRCFRSKLECRIIDIFVLHPNWCNAGSKESIGFILHWFCIIPQTLSSLKRLQNK